MDVSLHFFIAIPCLFIYKFFYCFQKRSLILKNTSAKPFGTKHGFKSIKHYGSKVFSKNKTYHRCQERRGKFNKNALY